MAQVKKFLNGSVIKAEEGNNGLEHQYKVILDGQTFTLNDDQLSRINNEIAALDPEHRQYAGGVSDTIKANAFKGSRPENKMSLSAYSGLNEKDLAYLKAGKRGYGEAFLKKPTYIAKETTNSVLDIITRIANEKPKDTREKLGSDVINLDYNTNSEGKRYLGPINYTAKDRVNRVLEHLQLGNDSKYNTEGWDFTNVSGWLNGLEGEDKYDAARKYFENLWSSMSKPGFDKEVGYNEQDIEDILNMFRIKAGNSASAPAGSNTKSDTQQQLEADFADNSGLYDIIGDNFEKGSDGVWRLKPGKVFNPGINLKPGQGIWFNDDFYNSNYGIDNRLAALKNLTYYNGALYKLDNPTLAKILNADGGYNARMKAGNWSGADDIILTRFTDSARNNPGFLGEDRYSTFLSPTANGRIGYRDLTGQVRWTGGTANPGDQIIQYVNLSDPSSVTEGNPYRRYTWKYGRLDDRGNYLGDIESNALEDIENGSLRETGLNTYHRIADRNNTDYYGRYYEDILDSEGNATGFRIYQNPDNPKEDVILHMPQINAQSTENKDLKLPPEIAKILTSNSVWLNNLVGNAQAQSDFIEVMSHLVQKWHARTDANSLFGSLFGMNDKQKLRRIFNDDEDTVNAFEAALKEAIKGKNAGKRRYQYTTTSPRLQRLGGILKHQNGGRAGGTTTSTGVTERRVNIEAKNFRNAAGITEIGSDNWTQADTMDLVALLGDLGSLGAAFVPGANVASAGIGAAASTARFAANKQRGTSGAGLNYAADLLMDAATLPFGGAAKGWKVVRAVKKALPTIVKAASVYGLGSAVVNSATKIANGEKWTSKDISMVVNALTAGVGLRRQGGFGKDTKTVNTKGYSETIKVGKNTTIELKDAEIRDIRKASDQPKALREAIARKAPNATQQEVANAAEGLLQERKSLFQRVTRKDGEIVLNSKKKKLKTTEAIEASGKSFHDWWYGVGDAKAGQTQYLRQLTGHKPIKKVSSHQEIVIPENSTPGLLDLNVPAVVRPSTRYVIDTKAPGIAMPQWINPYTTANYQDYEHQQPTGLVYAPGYKSGGKVVKAQNPTNHVFDINWKPDANFKINVPEYKTGYEPKSLINFSTDPVFSKSNDIVSNVTIPIKSFKFDPNWTPEKPTWFTEKLPLGKQENDLGGGFNKNISDLTKYINPAISAFRYIDNASGQLTDLELEKKKARDSIHPIYAHRFSGPNMNNPVFARGLNNIGQARAAGVLPPFRTSNMIDNFAMWNATNERLDKAENDLIGQESAWYTQQLDKARDAHDKTNNSAADVASEMAAQLSAANVAEDTAEQIYNQRKHASRANASMEIQNNVMNDRNKLLAFEETQNNLDIDKDFDSYLRTMYSNAASDYEALGYNEQAKYGGLADYIIRTVPGASKAIAQRQKADFLKKLQWQRDNALNYNYGNLTGQSSVISVKKGGRLNGRTRYTKEPDEQIWIDNNKAAHNQVAKLSDQILKILLRSLK